MNVYAEKFTKKEEHSAASCKIAGDGQFERDDSNYAAGKGGVLLLPAVVGACFCRPRGAVSLLEISLPGST